MVVLPRPHWVPWAKIFPFFGAAPGSQQTLHALGESIFNSYATRLVEVGKSIRADEITIRYPLSPILRIRRLGDPVFQIDDGPSGYYRIVGGTPDELRDPKNMIGWLEHPDDFSQPNLFAEQLWTQWNYELQRCVRDSKWAVVCRQSPTGPFKVLPPDSWSHFELTDYRAGLMRAASGECAFSTHFVPLSWPEELDVIAEELGIFGSSDGARANEEQVGPEEEPHEGTANPAVAGVSDPVAGKQRHTSREEKEYTRRLTAYMAENEPVLSKKKIRELTGGNRLPNAAFERSWDAADKASCKGFSSPGRRPSSGNFDTSPQADLPANEE